MNPNQAVIDSGKKFVLSVAGGGQGILGDLTRHGGMSNTLLEGIVPYSKQATDALIGGTPDKYVTVETARMLAMACYQRARKYAPDHSVIGVASTGSVVKVDGEREGRKHQLFIGIQDQMRTISVSFDLTPGRTREVEEQTAAYLIGVALKWGCGQFADMRLFLPQDDHFHVHTTTAHPHWIELVHGRRNSVAYGPTYGEVKAVFPSSCNPLHDGHIAIIRSAQRLLGQRVDVELCIKNADKPALDYTSIENRVKKTREKLEQEGVDATLYLSNKTLFFDKAYAYPGATFIVGSDTLTRVGSSRYQASLREFHDRVDRFMAMGCKFLVFPRKGEQIGSLDERLSRVVTIANDPGFTPSDISSTKIRREQDHAHHA